MTLENGDLRPDLGRDLWLLRPLKDTLDQHLQMFLNYVEKGKRSKPYTAVPAAELMGAMEVEIQTITRVFSGYPDLTGEIPWSSIGKGLEGFVAHVMWCLGTFDGLEKVHKERLKNLEGK